MPAAAVIPAPVTNFKVVAVKKLVVECLERFLDRVERPDQQWSGGLHCSRSHLYGRDGGWHSLVAPLSAPPPSL